MKGRAGVIMNGWWSIGYLEPWNPSMQELVMLDHKLRNQLFIDVHIWAGYSPSVEEENVYGASEELFLFTKHDEDIVSS